MVILTLNCGSSSAKYQVYDWDNKEVMANGVVERIGIEGSCITHKAKGQKTEIESPCPTHKEAIELIIKEITDPEVGVIKSMPAVSAFEGELCRTISYMKEAFTADVSDVERDTCTALMKCNKKMVQLEKQLESALAKASSDGADDMSGYDSNELIFMFLSKGFLHVSKAA